MTSESSKNGHHETDDPTLVSEFRNGNAELFDSIAAKYRGLVVNCAKRFDSDGKNFDDLYQEGLLALYRASCGYRGGVPFAAYASVCVKNAMLSWRRGNPENGVPSVSIDDLPEDALPDDTSATPEEEVVSKIFCNELKKRAMKLLSEYERCVFLLYLEDMTPAEIGDCLGKSKKSVENALNRIKSKLSASGN